MKLSTAVRVLRLLGTREESAMTIKQIRSAWQGAYDNISIRTLQRNLSELCAEGADGPALVNVLEETRELRYYLRLSEVSQWFMTEEAALGLLLARQVLERSFGKLEDEEALRRSDMAEEIIASSMRARRLRASLRVVPDGIGRLPAPIREEVLASVMDALADQRQLELHYKSRADLEAAARTCSPLGLVAKDGTMYLLAVRSPTGPVIHFALHRMEKAKVRALPAQVPPNFELDKYIDRSHQLSHALDDKGEINLVLRISPEAEFHFAERKLAANQQISSPDPETGKLIVTARIPSTYLLVPFLVSIGKIEVLEPAEIRKKVAEWHRSAADQYKDVM